MLLIGKDGIIGLEAVLVEQGLVAEGLDVLRGERWSIESTADFSFGG